MTARKKPAPPAFDPGSTPEVPSDPAPPAPDGLATPATGAVAGPQPESADAVREQSAVGTRTLESPAPGTAAHAQLVAEIAATEGPVAIWSGQVGFFHSQEDPGGLVLVAVDDRDGSETVKPIPSSVLKRGEFIAKMMGIGKIFGGFGGLD